MEENQEDAGGEVQEPSHADFRYKFRIDFSQRSRRRIRVHQVDAVSMRWHLD